MNQKFLYKSCNCIFNLINYLTISMLGFVSLNFVQSSVENSCVNLVDIQSTVFVFASHVQTSQTSIRVFYYYKTNHISKFCQCLCYYLICIYNFTSTTSGASLPSVVFASVFAPVSATINPQHINSKKPIFIFISIKVYTYL